MVQHNRVLLSGRIGTEETWSVGFNFMPPAIAPATYIDTLSGLNDWADQIAVLLVNPFYGSLALAMSDVTEIDTIVTQKIGVANNVTQQSVPTDADYQGNGAAYKPYPTAVVLSLRTSTPGASFRGRCYWPASGIGVNSSGRHGSAGTMSADFAQLTTDIATAAGLAAGVDPFQLCVFSRTLDVVTPVTSIRCGDVPDTQRRRRDALAETYETEPWPVP